MNRLMRFPDAVKRDPDIEAWMNEHSDELGAVAKYWFDVMRHLKLRPEGEIDASAVIKLIRTAYTDMKGRLNAE